MARWTFWLEGIAWLEGMAWLEGITWLDALPSSQWPSHAEHLATVSQWRLAEGLCNHNYKWYVHEQLSRANHVWDEHECLCVAVTTYGMCKERLSS